MDAPRALPLTVLPVAEQRWSCHGCGNCCRDFTVQLMEGEPEPRATPEMVVPEELPVVTPEAGFVAVPPVSPTGGVMSTTLVWSLGLAIVLPLADLK
jgi:hypothetical protein